jgi:hypothetical protein
MSEMTTTKSTALTTEQNAFEQFGASGSVGRYLRFNKGEFLCGDAENPDVIELGTRLIAEVPNMEGGWVKWRDKTPVDERMHLISERIPMPNRTDLGDNDPELWEKNKDGSPRDPWAETYRLTLRSVEDPDDDDAAFTFTTSSKGGRRAMKKLGGIFGKEGLRMRPGQLPIVELSFTAYDHRDHGRMKNPAFKVVGWMKPDNNSNGSGNGSGNGAAADEDTPPF